MRIRLISNILRILLPNDWGFYYTATSNLEKIKIALGIVKVLTDPYREQIKLKIDCLLKYVEDFRNLENGKDVLK